jgi:hypothetical protein
VIDEARLQHGSEPLDDLLGHAGAEGDCVLDVGEDCLQRRDGRLALGLRQDEVVVGVNPLRAADEPVDTATRDRQRLFLTRRDREDHRAPHARPAVRAIEPERVPAVPLPALDVGVVGALRY